MDDVDDTTDNEGRPTNKKSTNPQQFDAYSALWNRLVLSLLALSLLWAASLRTAGKEGSLSFRYACVCAYSLPSHSPSLPHLIRPLIQAYITSHFITLPAPTFSIQVGKSVNQSVPAADPIGL